MISIETADGQLVKVIQNVSNEKFGFHQLFGFIGLNKANKREESRKRQGFDFTNSQWKFHFDFNIIVEYLIVIFHKSEQI